MEIVEIGEDGLAQLVAVRNAVWPHDPLSATDYVDWRAQADHTLWLVAQHEGVAVGSAHGVVGWHSAPGVGKANVLVEPDSRSSGVGAALLTELSGWLREHGCVEATSGVSETDDASLAWAARRGFTEVGRSSILALDLSLIEAPEAAPPPGVEIVSWYARPELARAIYDVYAEAAPDEPGQADAEIAPFEDWLANDMQGAGDRPEATFVALLEGEVVGYAKLSLSAGATEIAWHDLTAVRRAARDRGIAGALKRAEIAWAKSNGYRFLKTFNEERNEPIRRLNKRHGYELEPGFITVRGSLASL